MANARVQRGRDTEAMAAGWFREHGWPHAERRPASLPGTDITGMPGLAPEVKARRDFSLTGWLKQAVKRRSEGFPFVVVRPDGYGAARIADWAVIMRLDDATALLRQAGYGDQAAGLLPLRTEGILLYDLVLPPPPPEGALLTPFRNVVPRADDGQELTT
jgi:hypothetical protein